MSASLAEAQRFLEEGRFDEALGAVRRSYDLSSGDEKVKEFLLQLLIADGVKRSRVARDLRRDEIRALARRERGSYKDSPSVREAFQAALKSLDEVLSVDSTNAKAMMLKAGVLDRMDREANRESVVKLFEKTLEIHPGNEELVYARERILSPCRHCGGSGFCPDCQGSGEVSALLVKSRCPTCNGSGVCSKCGLF